MVAYNFLPPTGQEAEIARAASARLSRDTEADEPAKLFVFSSHDEQPIELPARRGGGAGESRENGRCRSRRDRASLIRRITYQPGSGHAQCLTTLSDQVARLR